MFPKLWNETKNLAPEIYFGLQEPPPYRHGDLFHYDNVQGIVQVIREYCECDITCGYIEDNFVQWHDVLEDEIHVDLSKQTVFVYRRFDPRGSKPSPWQIFQFLQEPVRFAIFIGSEDALALEKTKRTYLVCRVLDQIWTMKGVDDLWSLFTDQRLRQCCLGDLMKQYEELINGNSSEMWRFWDTFYLHLLKERLLLRTFQIDLNEPPF